MKLHQLRNFIAVAENGSLRAAARELAIAQPAMTRSLQDLERELGAPLFERRSRGTVLTTIGTSFLQRAKSITGEVIRARDEIDQLRGMTNGNVSVALSMVPHLALLSSVLRPFRIRYPDVSLDIIDAVFPTVASRMGDGTIDCYIGPPPEVLPDGFTSEKLFDNTRVIVGRKGHPLSKARSLSELIDAEWITTSITARAEDELGPLFKQHQLPAPRLVLQAHSALTLIVSIISSDLLTMLPVQWTDFPLTKDALQTLVVKEILPAPPICIIRRSTLPLTPAADYFCDLVRRAAGHVGSSEPDPINRRVQRQSTRIDRPVGPGTAAAACPSGYTARIERNLRSNSNVIIGQQIVSLGGDVLPDYADYAALRPAGLVGGLNRMNMPVIAVMYGGQDTHPSSLLTSDNGSKTHQCEVQCETATPTSLGVSP